MQGLAYLSQRFMGIFRILSPWIPKMFVGFFLLYTFGMTFYKNGIQAAFEELALQLFTAEKTIISIVPLAVESSPEYGVFAVLELISAMLIIFYFLKIIMVAQVKIGGAQAPYSAWVLGIFVLAAVEISAAKVFTGEFFIPGSGLWMLLTNLEAVMFNIDWIPWW